MERKEKRKILEKLLVAWSTIIKITNVIITIIMTVQLFILVITNVIK